MMEDGLGSNHDMHVDSYCMDPIEMQTQISTPLCLLFAILVFLWSSWAAWRINFLYVTLSWTKEKKSQIIQGHVNFQDMHM